jgi:hypothetical protein
MVELAASYMRAADAIAPLPPTGCKSSAASNKEKPRQSAARLFCSDDGSNLTEPLHEFCLSFGLGSRLLVVIVIASRRQLVPVVGAAPFCDTGLDIDTASHRHEC